MSLHGTSTVGNVFIVLACCWFALNFYVWLFPKVRRGLIERRGPLLGVGYAFAAAFVSSTVDGVNDGWRAGLVRFVIRFIIVLLPFLVPFRIKLPRGPHPTDAAVLLYAILLPKMPMFQNHWIQLHADGFFGLRMIGPGVVTMVSFVSTYFFGIRWWSEIVMDWKLRRGDLKRALAAAGLGIFAVLIIAGTPPPWPLVERSVASFLATALVVAVVAVPFEEVVFRSLLLAGLKGKFLPRSAGWKRELISIVLVIIVAIFHGLFGGWALSKQATFALSVGIGFVVIRGNRFLPALLGHGLAMAGLLLFYGMFKHIQLR